YLHWSNSSALGVYDVCISKKGLLSYRHKLIYMKPNESFLLQMKTPRELIEHFCDCDFYSAGPSRDGTISEDTIRASLISAVSDKLRWRMKEEMDRAQAELNALKRTEEDLKKGHQKLEEMVTRLDQEVAEVDKNIDLLKKKDEELSSALEKMESQSENNDIDEVIVPTAPLYKQILNLYAEENAIEDTIFYLGEALRRGVIDLDIFLKHVRLLSRKQFQLRALMQKARKTAGLSDLY
uniref:Tumor susceptibility 101 n=1 Tax=Laticauda laticaudata TaxID=8630 RepID=A0A8C5RMZ9_LATLA